MFGIIINKKKLRQFRRRITYSDPFLSFISRFLTFFIKIYMRTIRVKEIFHPDFLNENPNQVFFGFWHGRQLLLVPGFARWRISIMSDLSWAGDIQARILKRLGYHIVRGSSKRQGTRALLHMKRSFENGYGGAFALDGPRGPVYQSKPGIVFLAQKLGAPVVPVAVASYHCWVLKKTWCKYEIPKPFSKAIIYMGKPMYLPKNVNTDLICKDIDCTLSKMQKKLEKKIKGQNGNAPASKNL